MLALKSLEKIVREKVRRALLEALIELLPYVDEEEQKEVEKLAGKPSDYKEEDFVEWNDR